jgi:hypothetical protein
MNKLVNNVKSVPGVIGVAIFKDDGSLVAFDFPEAYDKNLLDVFGRKFRPIKEVLPEEEGEIVYLCWEFENMLGFYYPVEGGWVNIISGEDIPMPVLSLTMTAVSNKLPELLKNAEGIAVQAAGTPAENVVPPEEIKELEKLFSLYLGPAAPVIFKRAAHQLGYTLANVPREKLGSVIDSIIAKVPDNKRDEAVEQVKKYF